MVGLEDKKKVKNFEKRREEEKRRVDHSRSQSQSEGRNEDESGSCEYDTQDRLNIENVYQSSEKIGRELRRNDRDEGEKEKDYEVRDVGKLDQMFYQTMEVEGD